MQTKLLTTIDGIIWLVAGVNVVRIGVCTWSALPSTTLPMMVGCLLTLAAFSTMFVKMVFKNVRRIQHIPYSHRHLWDCMPLRSFLVMAFMITLGITLRHLPSVPRSFIAWFYVGLGIGLSAAGAVYLSTLFWLKEHR